MPIEYQVTLYGCQFKCGHRHVKNLKLMVAHEARCWRNPEQRTCKTCQHEVYHTDTSGWSECGGGMVYEPEWYERSCGSGDPLGDELIGCVYGILHEHNPDNEHLYGLQIPPVVGCPCWGTVEEISP